jgi:hypothetical protein
MSAARHEAYKLLRLLQNSEDYREDNEEGWGDDIPAIVDKLDDIAIALRAIGYAILAQNE